jgi:hypothetical protein
MASGDSVEATDSFPIAAFVIGIRFLSSLFEITAVFAVAHATIPMVYDSDS